MNDSTRVPCEVCGEHFTPRGMTVHKNSAHQTTLEHPAAATVKRMRGAAFALLRGDVGETAQFGIAGSNEDHNLREIAIAVGTRLLEIIGEAA